jgi:hypothetical protein
MNFCESILVSCQTELIFSEYLYTLYNNILINVFVTFNEICEKFVSRFGRIKSSNCNNVGTKPRDRRPPHLTRAHAPTEHKQTNDLTCVRKEILLLSRDILAETFCTNIMRLYILNIFEYFCRNIFCNTNFINKFIRIWKLSVFVVLTEVVFSPLSYI